MNQNTVILIVVLAGVGIGGYMLYQKMQDDKAKRELDQSRSNKLSRDPSTAQQIQDYAKAAGGVIDTVEKAFGGW